MAKSRKRRPPKKRSTTFQLSGDGVALSLEPVRNPIPRGTFGSIGRFFRVSSDRPFSSAPILIPYQRSPAIGLNRTLYIADSSTGTLYALK